MRVGTLNAYMSWAVLPVEICLYTVFYSPTAKCVYQAEYALNLEGLRNKDRGLASFAVCFTMILQTLEMNTAMLLDTACRRLLFSSAEPQGAAFSCPESFFHAQGLRCSCQSPYLKRQTTDLQPKQHATRAKSASRLQPPPNARSPCQHKEQSPWGALKNKVLGYVLVA